MGQNLNMNKVIEALRNFNVLGSELYLPSNIFLSDGVTTTKESNTIPLLDYLSEI